MRLKNGIADDHEYHISDVINRLTSKYLAVLEYLNYTHGPGVNRFGQFVDGDGPTLASIAPAAGSPHNPIRLAARTPGVRSELEGSLIGKKCALVNGQIGPEVPQRRKPLSTQLRLGSEGDWAVPIAPPS